MTTISPLHSKQSISNGGLHGIVSYSYLSASARLDASGFDENDAYKLAVQTNDNSLWMLMTTGSIPTWMPVTLPSGSSGWTIVGSSLYTSSPVIVGSTLYASGVFTAALGMSGSLQQLASGIPYLVAQGSVFITTQSNGQIIISGSGGSGGGGSSGGGDPGASYIVVSNTGSLSNERTLVVGSGLILTDGGANTGITASINNNIVATISGSTFTGPISASAGLSGSLQLIAPNLTYLVAGANVTIASQSNGQIFISATGGGSGGGADPGVAYVTIGNTGSLANERALVAGTGLIFTDGGANNGVTGSVNDGIVATISGSRFTGPVRAAGGLSGSLQRLDDGSTYLIAGSNVTILSQSNGQVVISSTGGGGGGGGSSGWVDGVNKMKTTGSISIDSQNRYADAIGTDVFFFVSGSTNVFSGSNRFVSVFGGSTHVSGNMNSDGFVRSNAGLSGSLTTLVDGRSYLVGGTGGIAVSSQSNGQVTISSQNSVTGTLVTGGTYQISLFDQIIYVSASVHNITCSLPSPATMPMFLVKDVVGSSSNFPFQVKRNASERIENVASDRTLQSNYGAWTIFSDGTNWWMGGSP